MPIEHSELFQSYAHAYYAPVGTDLPDIDTEFGEAWPSPWTYIGETQSEATIVFEVPTSELTTEQRGVALEVPNGAEVTTLETTLAEINAKTIQLTFGGTKTIVNTPVPHTVIKGGGVTTFDYSAFAIEGRFPDGRPLRILFYIARSTVGGELVFGRESQGSIPFKLRAFPDPAKAKGENTWEMQFLN